MLQTDARLDLLLLLLILAGLLSLVLLHFLGFWLLARFKPQGKSALFCRGLAGSMY